MGRRGQRTRCAGVPVRVGVHPPLSGFNEEAQDFGYGKPFTQAEEEEILQALAPAHIKGLSLLGGEPFEPDNQRALVPFLRRVKEQYPQKELWCYSGYTLDRELWQPSRARCECTDEMLSRIDVLVDGPFVLEQKDLNLRFRGSSNQRILNLPASIAAHVPVLWDGDMIIQPITN